MYLADSQHLERFEKMRHDVNSRYSEWWLYRAATNRQISEDLGHILQMLKKELEVVGPFGAPFLKENQKTFKRDFYGIPLQHTFIKEDENNFEGIAYVATNDMRSVLLKSVFDYLRNEGNQSDFVNMNLTAICVQTAYSTNDEEIVIGVDCFEGLKPLSYYEHPINGRLIMAMGGNEVPEHSALAFHGKRLEAKVPLHQVLMEVNSLYQEYEFNNVSTEEVSAQLYSYFQTQK